MKIAFVDIDGTILDYPKGLNRPTSETIEMFRMFREQGNILIIATSRTELPEGLETSMFDGFVFSNGQYIEYHNQVLLNNCFSKTQIKYQLSVYQKYGAGSYFQGIKGQWLTPFKSELAIEHKCSEKVIELADDMLHLDLKKKYEQELSLNLKAKSK